MEADRRLKTINRIAAVSVILLSLIGGLVFTVVSEKSEKKKYPQKYAETVSREAAAAGIPDSAAYAAMYVTSGFDPAFTGDNGEAGLFGMTPEVFSELAAKSSESDDPRLLHDPEVAIRFGCMQIALLWREYRSWETVWTAFTAGRDTVEEQIAADGTLVLSKYPRAVTRRVSKLLAALEKYEELYGERTSSDENTIN